MIIITCIIMHWNHYLFSDWLKAYSEFWKSMPFMSSSCRLYKVMSRALDKAMGNHVMYISSALFLRVIMSNSHALCCLPSVFQFYFVQCIILQHLLFDSVFVISRIIKVLVRVTSLSLLLWLITPCSTLIILNKIIIKTSSNNCL